jgi:integrase
MEFASFSHPAKREMSKTLEVNLTYFNCVFGNQIVNTIKPADLENFQAKRKKEGYSDCYIDHQIGTARTMINKAFDNDKVGGDTLRVFKKVKKLLKLNANVRDRILSPEELERIMQHLPRHAKPIFATGFYTGMRRGEIASLTWDKVDLKKRVSSSRRPTQKTVNRGPSRYVTGSLIF